MSFRIIKLILINIIFLNYLNLSIASELIIPKNKPLININEIEFNKFNYLLPKEKPGLVKDQNIPKKKKEITELVEVKKKIKDVIIPLPKPIVVSKIKPPKKSKFYSKKDFARAKKAIKLMEQSKWYDALKEAWKAKDKSIYNLDSWASGIVDSVAGFPDGSYNGFELVDPSNYNLAATYKLWFGVLSRAVENCTEVERQKLFHDNARAYYHVE